MRNFTSKLSKIALFQFEGLKPKHFSGAEINNFFKFRIFPLFFDIYTPWEKYDILKNHAGSECEVFLPMAEKP